MRCFVLGCVLAVYSASSPAFADEGQAAAQRLRAGGIGVIVVGVLATIASNVLLGEGIGWELGNGLGEHYDPTPAWVPRAETAGWTLLGAGQGAIISGIVLVAVGDTHRDRARATVHWTVVSALQN
jgi:hypothetical protein